MCRAFQWCPALATCREVWSLSHYSALAWACDHLRTALQLRHCKLQASIHKGGQLPLCAHPPGQLACALEDESPQTTQQIHQTLLALPSVWAAITEYTD